MKAARIEHNSGNRRANFPAILLATWLCLVPAASLGAQVEAVVRLQPAESWLAPGDTLRLVVMIDQAAGLFGLELGLAFDPAVVQVIDAYPGQPGVQALPGGFLDTGQGFQVANSADNETGHLVYAFSLLNPAEPVFGSGPLLAIDLQAVAEGNTPLAVTAVLASADGEPLAVSIEEGSLLVGSERLPGQGSAGPILPAIGATATLLVIPATAGGEGLTLPTAVAAATQTAVTLATAVGDGTMPENSPLTATAPARATVTGSGQAGPPATPEPPLVTPRAAPLITPVQEVAANISQSSAAWTGEEGAITGVQGQIGAGSDPERSAGEASTASGDLASGILILALVLSLVVVFFLGRRALR